MKNFRVFLIAITASILFVGVLSSCSTDSVVTDAQRLADENALWTEYLKNNFELLKVNEAVNTKRIFGNIAEFKPIYMEKYADPVYANNDTISNGKTVAYRYTLYNIGKKSVDKVVDKVPQKVDVVDTIFVESNLQSALPAEFTVGKVSTSTGYEVLPGFSIGLRHMRKNTEAIFIIPSVYLNGSYTSSFFKIKVVNVSR